MTKHFFGDTAVLTGRSLRHIMRSPDTIITTTIMPIAFMLLFVYVFGGAISAGSGSARYVQYLLPGILLITIASSIAYTAFRLFTDMQSGIFERFQSMPGPVQWFAEHQPVTSIVDTIRALLAQQPVGTDIWVALAWCVGVLVVAYAGAMAVYRRKTA